MLPNFSYNERLKRLDLQPLVYRREVKDLSTFYKLKSGNFNCSFNSYFEYSAFKYFTFYACILHFMLVLYILFCK